MGHQEAGDPALFPADFTVPDDGDPKNASSWNVAFEALADRTAWLKAHSPRLQAVVFTATGSIVIPERVVAIIGAGWGAGGAGGRGGVVATGTSKGASGGSGGGGSEYRVSPPVPVTPGETIDVVIGAGGSGLDANNNGNPGGDSKIQRAGADLAVFPGAGGGVAGDGTTGAGGVAYAAPGLPVRPGAGGGITDYATTGGRTVTTSADVANLAALTPRPPGAGGFGFGATTMTQGGMRNAYGSGVGGAPGTVGATVSSYLGGGGGAGGGAGPGGNGGAGGNGPPGTASVGNTGAFGTAAAANSGGGGGGGGGAGGCASAPSTGGTGGAGGSGKMTIFYVLESP